VEDYLPQQIFILHEIRMEFKNQMEDDIVEAHEDKQNSVSQLKITSFFKEALASALKHGNNFQPRISTSFFTFC